MSFTTTIIFVLAIVAVVFIGIIAYVQGVGSDSDNDSCKEDRAIKVAAMYAGTNESEIIEHILAKYNGVARGEQTILPYGDKPTHEQQYEQQYHHYEPQPQQAQQPPQPPQPQQMDYTKLDSTKYSLTSDQLKARDMQKKNMR
jgi:hypothetical protein